MIFQGEIEDKWDEIGARLEHSPDNNNRERFQHLL
jgi:hypothetical protein